MWKATPYWGKFPHLQHATLPNPHPGFGFAKHNAYLCFAEIKAAQNFMVKIAPEPIPKTKIKRYLYGEKLIYSLKNVKDYGK